jgi:hypothetical protein
MKNQITSRRVRSRIGVAALLALIAAAGHGCSGINASKSVSPLDFFLPGLLQNEPPEPVVPDGSDPSPELAHSGEDVERPRPTDLL